MMDKKEKKNIINAAENATLPDFGSVAVISLCSCLYRSLQHHQQGAACNQNAAQDRLGGKLFVEDHSGQNYGENNTEYINGYN